MNKRTKIIIAVLAVILGVGAVIYFARANRPAGGSETKRVLVVLPLTGPAASWGEHFKRGADMFVRTQKNPHIQIQIIDSQTNAGAAMSAVQQATLAGKPYAIVSTTSTTTVPLSEWSRREGIFLVACVITDKVLADPTLVQRVYPSVKSNADPLAKYASSHFKKVAILYSNEELGLSVRREFERAYTGGQIVLADGYALNVTDVRSLVTKYIQAEPEAVLVTGVGPAFWAIIRELKGQGYKGQILSDASFADPVQIAQLGPIAEGTVFVGSETELSEPRSQAAQEFNREFASAFGVPVNYTGVTVYESLRMLDRLAESTPELKTESFRSLGEWQGVPGPIRILPGGDCDYPWFLMQRTDGRNVPLPQ